VPRCAHHGHRLGTAYSPDIKARRFIVSASAFADTVSRFVTSSKDRRLTALCNQ
jgi:hypothetical protein